jgi:hypothetical protein
MALRHPVASPFKAASAAANASAVSDLPPLAAGLAVRADHLDHLDTTMAKVAGQPRRRSCRFPSTPQLQQLGMRAYLGQASTARSPAAVAENAPAAHLVDHRGRVHVSVSVHVPVTGRDCSAILGMTPSFLADTW